MKYAIIYDDINHNKARHSRESGNPGRHWIPGQTRNDKPNGRLSPQHSLLFVKYRRGIMKTLYCGGLIKSANNNIDNNRGGSV
jgi:hypothetical protein